MLFPLAALAIGAVISVVLSVSIRENIEKEAQLHFERQASDAQHVIEARIKSYFEVLHGLRALFARSGAISRADFHSYVEALDPTHRYPGFQSLNYAEYVTRDAKAGFEARVRRDTSLERRGYPGFAIRPAGDRPDYFVVSYIDPMGGNEFSFGLDISTNPAAANPQAIAAALALARDSGALTSSGQLLKFGIDRAFALLAIRLPAYRPGMPVQTVEQRRAAYLGSVGASYRVRDLIRLALDESTLQTMRFKLYDAGPARSYVAKARAVTEEHLLFDSSNDLLKPSGAGLGGKPPHFEATLPMEIASRVWEVHFSGPRQALIDGIDVALPWLVLCGGVLTSLLLFGMLSSLASSRGRAQHRAHHDDLTTLPNRSFFSKLLNHAISQARRHDKRLAVLFIDLDGFKNINDSLGHAAGDALLQEVGRRLKKCVRESDIVARLGGDEFVVLLERLEDQQRVSVVAQKILAALTEPCVTLGPSHITASIGISAYPADGPDEQALMKGADVAMYRAKAAGKNNFRFYSPELGRTRSNAPPWSNPLNRDSPRAWEARAQAKVRK